YDEEHRLDVGAFRSCRDADFHFVNDGSRDGTLAVLQSLVAEDPGRFHLLNLPQNRGKAEAVRLGMLAAMERSPAYVAFWDADLATPLGELPRFIEILEIGRAHV